MKSYQLLPLILVAGLSACDLLGIPDPAKEAAAKDAEGKAIGGACRHAGRALEDCFTLNPAAPKASVFSGWKDMNDYMVQNKIDTVKPELPPPGAAAKTTEAAAAESTPPAEEEPAASPTKTRPRGSKPGSSTHER